MIRTVLLKLVLVVLGDALIRVAVKTDILHKTVFGELDTVLAYIPALGSFC